MPPANDDPPPPSASTTQRQNATSQPPQPAAATDRSNFVYSDETNLKRNYLRLLPLVQVVEICLSFDPYVPAEVKNRIWPVDFHSAIAALQLEASVLPKPSGSSHDTMHGHALTANASATIIPFGLATTTVPSDEPPIMDSLQNPALTPNTPTAQSDQASTSSAATEGTPASKPGRESQPVAGPSNPSTPAPSTQPSTSTPYSQTRLPYPHVPYGYHPHMYPHASYYGHPPPGYPPHYPVYPSAYPHYPPANAYPSNPQTPPVPPYNQPPPMRPPISGEPPGGSAEDLPSYEDMIVEALTGCADPEGLAPKNMFLWMAARYPLQSNFRPSASQALQKAFKRGRLEKSNDGKYRLNAAWEGGSTSKRTTRRPQTQSQVALSQDSHFNQNPKSPFTRAPLTQRAGSTPANVIPPNYNSPIHAGAAAYPFHTNGYPGYQYPGYPIPSHVYQAQAQIVTATGESTSGAASNISKPDTNTRSVDADHLDAWEAAQNILKAINFGSLLSQSSAGSSASGTIGGASTGPELISAGSHPAPTLTDEEKAALQAQIALLAAQLEEIAEEEEALIATENQGTHDNAAVAPLQGQLGGSREEDDDDSDSEDDDEDMEMVEISVPVAGART